MDALIAKAKELFKEQKFVVLDTETTGTDIWSTEVVEIVILDHNRIPLLNSLVKPGCPIPARATGIHGITDTMVKDAPTFPEIFPQIDALLKEKTVVVYNADYDISLIQSLVARHKLLTDWSCKDWCLMQAYADYRKTPGRYGDYKWHKLGDACKYHDIVLTDSHRALGDALATWSLLKVFADME